MQSDLTENDRKEWIAELSELTPWERQQIASYFGLSEYPPTSHDLFKAIENSETAKGMQSTIDKRLKSVFEIYNHILKHRNKPKTYISTTTFQSTTTLMPSKSDISQGKPQHTQLEWTFVSSLNFWTLDITIGLHNIELINFFPFPYIIVELTSIVQLPEAYTDNNGIYIITLPYLDYNEDYKVTITSKHGIDAEKIIQWLTEFQKFARQIEYNVNESI